MTGDPYIPETGLCPACGKLLEGHPDVERLLAEKGYRYYDADQSQMVQRVGIQFCRCAERAEEENRERSNHDPDTGRNRRKPRRVQPGRRRR